MTNITDNQALTLDAILAKFDELAEQRLDDTGRRCDEVGLPADAYEEAYTNTALALSGVRLALTKFSPRPAIASDDDKQSFMTWLEWELDERCRYAVMQMVERRDHSTFHTLSGLREWNGRRKVVSDERMSHETWLLTHDKPVDSNHMERVELEDGKFRFDYTLKPVREKDK